MAEVNAKMVVSSNYTAAITPMFVEDAAAVTVAAGDNNMPFSYVDWKALQSDVVDGGVTFMIQKTAMGANQEMEPTGDVAYVTCGPFDCVSGDTAPEITIMDDEMLPDVGADAGGPVRMGRQRRVFQQRTGCGLVGRRYGRRDRAGLGDQFHLAMGVKHIFTASVRDPTRSPAASASPRMVGCRRRRKNGKA